MTVYLSALRPDIAHWRAALLQVPPETQPSARAGPARRRGGEIPRNRTPRRLVAAEVPPNGEDACLLPQGCFAFGQDPLREFRRRGEDRRPALDAEGGEGGGGHNDRRYAGADE